jgi:hypothetical protein
LEEVFNKIFNLGLICYQEIIGGRQVEKWLYKSIQKIRVFWRGYEREE